MAEHPADHSPVRARSCAADRTPQPAPELSPNSKGAEGVLRWTEGQYRLLFDKNPLPAWVFDRDTLTFLAVNEAAVQHYGFPRQEFLSLTLEDIHPPEDRPGLLAHLATAPAEGEDRSGVWRHRKQDGTVCSVELDWQDVAFGGCRARLVMARDVTERQQADEESHESERRLRQLAENVRAVFWMTDARATRLLYVSPMYEEVWGRTCQSLYEHPETWQQAIHPDDREAAARVFDRFGRSGEPYQQQYRVVRPDGSVRWVRDRGFPVKDLAGRVYRVAGITEDITDQEHRDEELRRHALRQEVLAVLGRSALADTDLRALLNGAARMVAQAEKVEYATVWELLPGGLLLRARAGVGWTAEAIGDQATVPGTDSQAGYTLLGNEPVVVDDLPTERRFRDPILNEHRVVSGLSVVIHGPVRPFGVFTIHTTRSRRFTREDGHFLQAVANVLAEAVARKAAEETSRESERFSQVVLDSLSAQIAVVDDRGTILAVNEGWRTFALENGGILPGCGVGADYLAICRRAAGEEEGAAAVLRGLQAVLDGSLPLFTHEYPCHSPTRQRWFLLRATPCAARQRCAVVAHIDITERKLAEARLQEANRHKDEFLAVLAHELRNPLAPIWYAIRVMKQPGAPVSAVERVRDMMERQIRHLSRLIDDLLDVSRIDRGRIDLRKQVLDVASVVDRTVESVRPLFEERRQELTVSLPEDPVRLAADPDRLGQILYNLLSNACKYTDPGGRVWLTAGREGAEVVLRVRDTGIGIAPGMLPGIFDLFVQVERRLDRSQGGVGIGLTLVKQLVELHGGTVAAYSAGLGQGSEFVVRLPVLPDQEGGEAADPSRTEGTPAVSCRRVLVADDNEDAADSLALLLRALGYEVRVAYDGVSALEAARTEPPDVAILDIGMPGLDGYEVARRLRQQPGLEDMLLVALTGWGQEADRRRSREAGLDYHLVKPLDPDGLLRLLANPIPRSE